MLCSGLQRFASLAIAGILALAAVLPCQAQQDDLPALMKKMSELAQAGRYGDAIPLARRLVREGERVSGPDSPLTAVALLTLGQALQAQGQLSEALASF